MKVLFKNADSYIVETNPDIGLILYKRDGEYRTGEEHLIASLIKFDSNWADLDDSEIYFLDDDGDSVDIKDAKRAVIQCLDENGKLINKIMINIGSPLT
jgi:hypothetical protein